MEISYSKSVYTILKLSLMEINFTKLNNTHVDCYFRVTNFKVIAHGNKFYLTGYAISKLSRMEISYNKSRFAFIVILCDQFPSCRAWK